VAHSNVAGRANAVVPRSIRLAATCFLVLSGVLGLYVIWKAVLVGPSWRDLLPALGALVALYLWMALRRGEDRDARSTGLMLGVLTMVNSGAFLVYGIMQLPALDTSREAVILLVDVLFLGPAVAFVASCAAVALLMRAESKAFFQSSASP